jgi:signal transduction histidine kinase
MPAADTRLDELLGAGAAVFRASMAQLPDPIGVWWAVRDAAGAVVDFETGYANPAMLALFGVSVQRSLGRRLLEESPAYRDEAAFKAARGVVESGVPAVLETVVDRAAPIGRLSGSFVHRAVPFGPDGVLNLLTDITHQRRSEAELERYAQVAAHDLREPLMAVGLFVEQLASGLDRGREERNEHLVALMRRTLVTARALVDGILEYSRCGASVQFDQVDMAVVVADVLSLLSARAAAMRATFEVTELPTIAGSAPQLGRVVQNLVANSLKYTSGAPPHVKIWAERTDGFWLFTVEDNGPGMPPGLGDDAFAMFRRVGVGDDVSCGIGLAVCRRIIEAHGGAIVAEPACGGGTAMRFSVPD